MLDGMGCRAAAVRRYFGEEGVEPCGHCDLCTAPPAAVDATEAAQKTLSAVHRLGGRFGRGRVVDHLLGKTKEPSPVRGRPVHLRRRPRVQPRRLARPDRPAAVRGPAAARTPTTAGRWWAWATPPRCAAVYRGERRVKVRRAARGLRRRSDRPARAGRASARAASRWRRWPRPTCRCSTRCGLAQGDRRRQAVPPYVIFHDRTLAEIARGRPGDRRRPGAASAASARASSPATARRC